MFRPLTRLSRSLSCRQPFAFIKFRVRRLPCADGPIIGPAVDCPRPAAASHSAGGGTRRGDDGVGGVAVCLRSFVALPCPPLSLGTRCISNLSAPAYLFLPEPPHSEAHAVPRTTCADILRPIQRHRRCLP
jgi:hypothetical protein